MPDFSVITVSLNSGSTIQKCAESIYRQIGVDIQHIVKDGLSTDDTIEKALAGNPSAQIVKGSDEGIYDAMNQGFKHAKGEFVAFLNSDDEFTDYNVLKDVKDCFLSGKADIVFGDICICNDSGKVVRFWSSGNFLTDRSSGSQIPHPGLFIRRELLSKLDEPFDSSYKISADFKQQLVLFETMDPVAVYINRVVTNMLHGGASSQNISAISRGLVECMRAYREVTGKSGLVYVANKLLRKTPQLFRSPFVRSY